MATIFPGSASVGQIFEGYSFNGTAWDIIGIDLTADYLENSTASATYLNKVSASNTYLTQTSASSTYQTSLSVGTGLTLNSSTVSVNPGAMLNQIVGGTSGNSYGLVGTSTYLDVKDTNGYNKEIELDIAAVESQLETDGFLKNSSASGTYLTQVSASTTYANPSITPISGFRNLLINGDMRINQRAVTSGTADGTYCFDRWKMNNSGGTCTYTAQTFTLGNAISGYEPTNYARIVTSGQSTSGHFAMLRQNIEDVRTFAGQTVTVSFWAKAGSGTPKVALELEQNFGTGGSPSSAVTTYAGQVTLSTSWARYSLTVTMPSISGKTIGTTENTSHVLCSLFVSAGSDWNARTGTLGIQSNTFDFWGVQAEKGTVATPFEQRPIGTELGLCQRYYWRWNTNGNSYAYYSMCVMRNATGFTLGTGLKHPVTMRAVPSISFNSMFGEVPSGGGKALANGLVTNNLSTVENVGFIATADSNWGASEPGFVRANTTTAAYVEHNAEL